jgi:hypothetical protein
MKKSIEYNVWTVEIVMPCDQQVDGYPCLGEMEFTGSSIHIGGGSAYQHQCSKCRHLTDYAEKFPRHEHRRGERTVGAVMD